MFPLFLKPYLCGWMCRQCPQAKHQTLHFTSQFTTAAAATVWKGERWVCSRGGKGMSPKPKPTEAAPGMNGAVEVPRPPAAANITVFEFGSVAVPGDKVTLAGYCPVSEDMKPCRWEILPASGSEAPQFRVVF